MFRFYYVEYDGLDGVPYEEKFKFYKDAKKYYDGLKKVDFKVLQGYDVEKGFIDLEKKLYSDLSA